MTLTLEPGTCTTEGRFQIEENLTVTESGVRWLSQSPRDLDRVSAMTAAPVLDEPLDLNGLARPGDHRYTHRIITLADGSTVTLPVIAAGAGTG